MSSSSKLQLSSCTLNVQNKKPKAVAVRTRCVALDQYVNNFVIVDRQRGSYYIEYSDDDDEWCVEIFGESKRSL